MKKIAERIEERRARLVATGIDSRGRWNAAARRAVLASEARRGAGVRGGQGRTSGELVEVLKTFGVALAGAAVVMALAFAGFAL